MVILAIIGFYALSILYILGFERREDDMLFDLQPTGFMTFCYIFAPITASCCIVFDLFKILTTPVVGVKEIIERFRS